MSIIVEIKSNNKCCRQNVLKENVVDDAINFITSDTNSAAMAVRTALQEVLVEQVIEFILGRPVDEDMKRTILYKTFTKTVAMVDADEVLKLIQNDSGVCATIAANLITALIKVVNNEIIDELGELSADIVSDKVGAGGSVADAIIGVVGSVEKPLVAMVAEKIKELPELEMLSNKICEIEFMDVIRDIPGADTLISFFDGE